MIQDKPMHTTVPLTDWYYITTQRLEAEAENFIKQMQQVASKMGFKMAPPVKVMVHRDGGADYVQAVEDILARNPNPRKYMRRIVPKLSVKLTFLTVLLFRIDFPVLWLTFY